MPNPTSGPYLVIRKNFYFYSFFNTTVNKAEEGKTEEWNKSLLVKFSVSKMNIIRVGGIIKSNTTGFWGNIKSNMTGGGVL